MSIVVIIGGAIAFLAVLCGLASFAPKLLEKIPPGPNAGDDAAAGGGYGYQGMDHFTGDAGGGDGD